MTGKVLITLALIVAATTPTWSAESAETYTYNCKVNHKTYPVKIDVDSGTLTWRGTVYRNLKPLLCGKAGYEATSDGITAELCAATKGVADLTIGSTTFNCQMPR